MKNIKYLIVLIAASAFSQQSLAECNEQNTGGGEILGTLAGAAIGGLLGSQIGSGTGNSVAIGAGVVAGGLLGNRLGQSLDCQDQQYHQQTTQNALETQKTGQSSSWVNPDSGHSGEVTPTRTYTTSEGQACRDFTQTIYVDGEYEEVEGTACRQDDGSWAVTG